MNALRPHTVIKTKRLRALNRVVREGFLEEEMQEKLKAVLTVGRLRYLLLSI